MMKVFVLCVNVGVCMMVMMCFWMMMMICVLFCKFIGVDVGKVLVKEWSMFRWSVFVVFGVFVILCMIGVGSVMFGGGKVYVKVLCAKADFFADVLKDSGFLVEYLFGEKEMVRYDESFDFIFYF